MNEDEIVEIQFIGKYTPPNYFEEPIIIKKKLLNLQFLMVKF